MTEEALVQRARQGDPDAFEQLMRDNQNRIYTLALRMAGNPEDAMDLSQEAMIRAWKGLKDFRGGSSFSTWVYRLTSNVCLDFLRREKRRQGVEGGPSLDDEEAPLPQPADHSGDPHALLEQKELRHTVEQSLQELPPHHRQVLVMRELSGMSYQEIGQALELDPGTVKSRIARARQALKKNLLQKGNLFPGSSSNPANTKGGDPE